MSNMFADTIIVNASVHTLDPARPGCDTIVMAGGRVVATGDAALLKEHRGSDTSIVDAQGHTVTPGLIDAHIHPIEGVEATIGVDFGGVKTLEGFLAALRAEADRVLAHEPSGWVRGWNVDYGVFEGRPITAELIEGAVRGLPTFLQLFDLHTVLASRAALKAADITGPRRFPDSSEIVVTDEGLPTGELREASAYALVAAAAPALTRAQAIGRAREIMMNLAKSGITAGSIMDGDIASLDFLDEIDSTDAGLPVRLVAALGHKPGMDAQAVRDYLAAKHRSGRRWRGGLIKMFLDGVIDTGTGWMYEADTSGEGLYSFWPDPSEFPTTVKHYSDEGFQIATHAIGDRAIGVAIDAYIAAGVASTRSAPHRIEHLECLADQDLPRLAGAGITASMQPLHMQWRNADGSDSWSSRLGPDRASLAWRVKDILTSGAPLALGSDWPVAQYDVRIGMAWARLRRTPGQPDAHVFEPAQRLSPTETLKGFTLWAARAQGDNDAGSIRPGYRADLTMWADDPLKVSGDQLIDVPITSTWVDGAVVFAGEE
ncbi:amidohydrolase [Arthrobacter sp. ERGS1:01]|uniref:amidohydrolase n=1 Tax=Arthrobacter sp. ERGS1:01 TaxID=1704044 RepID=UPI0006B5666B|nr:amidohydrolase [Arthrobacter sp. ERGS1:01]ALE04873.1 amidohydrolase [Arthrobacter sp. ERGS1:01]